MVCFIGGILFPDALCDMGANINIMTLSTFKNLGLPKPNFINTMIRVVDRMVIRFIITIEDGLLCILDDEKCNELFIFLMDFNVFYMEDDAKSVILGHPFLMMT